MKSIVGSTNAAIMAMVAARGRVVTAFHPGSAGRLFSSAGSFREAGRRGGSSAYMYGLATATAVAMGASSRCVHVLLGETMLAWTERGREREAEAGVWGREEYTYMELAMVAIELQLQHLCCCVYVVQQVQQY